MSRIIKYILTKLIVVIPTIITILLRFSIPARAYLPKLKLWFHRKKYANADISNLTLPSRSTPYLLPFVLGNITTTRRNYMSWIFSVIERQEHDIKTSENALK